MNLMGSAVPREECLHGTSAKSENLEETFKANRGARSPMKLSYSGDKLVPSTERSNGALSAAPMRRSIMPHSKRRSNPRKRRTTTSQASRVVYNQNNKLSATESTDTACQSFTMSVTRERPVDKTWTCSADEPNHRARENAKRPSTSNKIHRSPTNNTLKEATQRAISDTTPSEMRNSPVSKEIQAVSPGVSRRSPTNVQKKGNAKNAFSSNRSRRQTPTDEPNHRAREKAKAPSNPNKIRRSPTNVQKEATQKIITSDSTPSEKRSPLTSNPIRTDRLDKSRRSPMKVPPKATLKDPSGPSLSRRQDI